MRAAWRSPPSVGAELLQGDLGRVGDDQRDTVRIEQCAVGGDARPIDARVVPEAGPAHEVARAVEDDLRRRAPADEDPFGIEDLPIRAHPRSLHVVFPLPDDEVVRPVERDPRAEAVGRDLDPLEIEHITALRDAGDEDTRRLVVGVARVVPGDEVIGAVERHRRQVLALRRRPVHEVAGVQLRRDDRRLRRRVPRTLLLCAVRARLLRQGGEVLGSRCGQLGRAAVARQSTVGARREPGGRGAAEGRRGEAKEENGERTTARERPR